MKVVQIIFLFFLIVPFVEIYLLLQLGSIVGVFPTVLLVVFTAVLGAWLLRRQGFSTLQRFQANLAKGEIPAYEMIEGPILLVGGALLLTPGFFTDAMGFACLIPQARRKFARYVIEKQLINMQAGSAFQRPPQQQDSNVIEGEFKKDE
ncbi:MAG: FxsA family protein [Methylococcales symbiont of Hymedesmia sp. n. MRB-2018]|nr:MAG: FxsA family protein [Methylococcales symbiont of Hymedesmia sp. n. MRB-2018]KAF3983678.1 MAG: FxsA family protein [Methylococcales symbiont of Hymedesmia sp. n. MRB-2018]